MKFFLSVVTAALFVGSPTLQSAQALEKFPACRMVQAAWADGDSFLIQTQRNEQHTIRLYGADCLELHVNDDTDARRLRAQRRYFGISEAGGSPQASPWLRKRATSLPPKQRGPWRNRLRFTQRLPMPAAMPDSSVFMPLS